MPARATETYRPHFAYVNVGRLRARKLTRSLAQLQATSKQAKHVPCSVGVLLACQARQNRLEFYLLPVTNKYASLF